MQAHTHAHTLSYTDVHTHTCSLAPGGSEARRLVCSLPLGGASCMGDLLTETEGNRLRVRAQGRAAAGAVQFGARGCRGTEDWPGSSHREREKVLLGQGEGNRCWRAAGLGGAGEEAMPAPSLT